MTDRNSKRGVGFGLAAIGLIILFVTLHAIGSRDVLEALKRCSRNAIAAATALVILGTILGAWNCFRIADLRQTLTFPEFLRLFWRSWAVGLTFPGQVGDMVSTLWQLNGRSTDLSFVAGRLLLDKAITLAVMLVMLAIAPVAVGLSSPFLSFGLLALLATAVCAAPWALRAVDANPDPVARWPFGSRLLPAIRAAHAPARMIFENTALTLLKVFASGCSYWVVLRSISSNPLGLLKTTVISQSAGLVAYLPVSFNGLGTVELSAIALFRAIGLGSASVLSAYLVLRTINLATAWIPAVIGFAKAGVSPKD